MWAGVEEHREVTAFSITLKEVSTSRAEALSRPEWWLKKATQGQQWSVIRIRAETHAAVLLKLCMGGRRLVKNATRGSQMSLQQKRRERQTQLPTRSSGHAVIMSSRKQIKHTY